jgi:L-lactate dehydrogenase complex protein LldE
MTAALFVPCYIDQLYPQVAIAALTVLERLGVDVVAPDGAMCCGQPLANAGFEQRGEPMLVRFVETFRPFEQVIVLSGSCALHVRAHAGAVHGGDGSLVAGRTTEFCAFLHDEIGLRAVATLGATFARRVGLHIGCHGLRGLGLARPSELQTPSFNKVRALLETVGGIDFVDPARTDECCGFGGTFAVGEPAISAKMGRDRLRDYARAGAEAIVSTDMSCLMHIQGLALREGGGPAMLHVAQVLAGEVGLVA